MGWRANPFGERLPGERAGVILTCGGLNGGFRKGSKSENGIGGLPLTHLGGNYHNEEPVSCASGKAFSTTPADLGVTFVWAMVNIFSKHLKPLCTFPEPTQANISEGLPTVVLCTHTHTIRVYICMCIYVYICIYIYIHIPNFPLWLAA